VVRKFFKWCVKVREYIDRDPYDGLHPYPKQDPVTIPLTPTEMKALLRATDELDKLTPLQRFKPGSHPAATVVGSFHHRRTEA
jgi:hypothetical protein